MNHDEDHLHFMVTIPPKMSVGSVVRIVKTNTSRGLKRKFEYLKDIFWKTDGIWSDGYFVSTIGVNEEVIQKYIEQQGKEDPGQAKLILD
jgi:putative transposase